MPRKIKPPGMWEVAMTMGSPEGEPVYAAFLKARAECGDYTFLLDDIRRSNLRPATQAVARALINGKLKRLKHRPPEDETDLKNAYRALVVMDIEADGCPKREAAIEEARGHLRCSHSTIEKALKNYEDMLKAARPEFLDSLRSAFK